MTLTVDDFEEISGTGGISPIQLGMNQQMTGTAPTVVGTLIKLSAKTYPAPSAQIGCGNPAHTATLELWDANGNTVFTTIGGTAGGLAVHTAASGFTLDAETDIELVLFTDNAAGVALIRGFLM